MSIKYSRVNEPFSKQRLLCVGDIMLDRFVYGKIERISPEAPVPVFSIGDESIMLGGAGNVAKNLSGLGAHTMLVSVSGDETSDELITKMAENQRGIALVLIPEKNRITTTKTRYVAGSQQVLRTDKEIIRSITGKTETRILQIVKNEMDKLSAIILSDYGKGVLTKKLCQEIITLAKAKRKPVFIDPKSPDFSMYSRATFVCPNVQELANASGMALQTDTDIVQASQKIIADYKIENVLVTRGKEGMTLVKKNNDVVHISAQAKEIFDVSGAGDTVVATLALAAASGMSVEESAKLANIAAGIVVGKLGTAAITAQDLEAELFAQEEIQGRHKIVTLHDAKSRVERWIREGETIGFTNGCFDVLHAGHLAILNGVKTHCDKLVIGLNSDASVTRLKGKGRPVNGQMERALLLASLSIVDAVIIFHEDTPIRLIESLKPHVLAKGSEYKKREVVGQDYVESYGGKIVLIPMKEGHSTTRIVDKCRNTSR